MDRKELNGIMEVKAFNDADFTIDAYITTDTRDRADEILTKDGWETENYQKNPVVMWAHDYGIPPVGKNISLKFDENGIFATTKFAIYENYEFAKLIYQLCRDKFINATSVGFIPKEWKRENKQDSPLMITKKELVEYSICPVPCNPDALQNALKTGGYNTKGLNIKELFNIPLITKPEPEVTEDYIRIKKELEELKLKTDTSKTNQNAALDFAEIKAMIKSGINIPEMVRAEIRYQQGGVK